MSLPGLIRNAKLFLGQTILVGITPPACAATPGEGPWARMLQRLVSLQPPVLQRRVRGHGLRPRGEACFDDPAGHELHLINIHTISGQAERFIPGKDAHARSRFKKTCVKNPITHVASTLAATQSASTLAATQTASTLAATQSVNPYWVVMGDCHPTKDEAMDIIFSPGALVHHDAGPPLVACDKAHKAVIAGVQPIEVFTYELNYHSKPP